MTQTMEKALNVRLTADVYQRLSRLTQATGRTKSFLVMQALDKYLADQEWQIEDIKAAIIEADNNDFASDEEISAIFKKYEN